MGYIIGNAVKRPWGTWTADGMGENFVRKTLVIKPGGCSSLHKHEYRSERLTVMRGTAEVTVGKEVAVLEADDEISIPQGSKHRVKNIGTENLIIREVQTGEILDECDIVRYSDVYGRCSIVYISDMDGTLTPARLPMTDEFAEVFEKFVERHPFYIISGSDFKKIKEQIPGHILDKVAGVYCSMGNEFFVKNELKYEKKFSPSRDLIDCLEKYRLFTRYPGKLFPNYVEKRKGMVNFSVLGRDCPLEARANYKKWDDEHHERRQIAEELSRMYPEYDISLGGNISIDIVPHGFGKEQAAPLLRSKYPLDRIIFLGDRTEKGGNDYPLAQAVLQMDNSEVVAVSGPNDTLEFLKENL